ncbi:MAG: 2-aminoadipate transaminase [Clostridiales bacterium]|nr:2-aminoadipate transaminase [Clostridiales bacterium]
MEKHYSQTAKMAKGSDVRALLKHAANPNMISFGGGLPSKDAFPMDDIHTAIDDAIKKHGHLTLQYGETEGVKALIEQIKIMMTERGITGPNNEVLITTGSQQGLDLCGKLTIDPGDVVLCESPTYLAAINVFKTYNPTFVDIPMDDEGVLPEALEKALKAHTVKMVYLIPDFQNPTGRTLSLERRKRIVELANQYDVLIVEDSPYSELNYSDEKLPPLKHFDTEGRVIYLSTFSKIICPGFRLGWIAASPELIQKLSLLKENLDLHTNQFVQYAVSSYLNQFNINDQIHHVVELYRVKRDAMLAAIEKYFPENIYYSKPIGGMFIWIELPEHLNSRELLQKTLEKSVAFVPGESFYPNGGSYNALRMNFSNASLEDIDKGVAIIADALKSML